MPRSGYDSTNCKYLQEARRNHKATQPSHNASDAGIRTTSKPESSTPVSDLTPSSSPYSPIQTPMDSESSTAEPSSSPASSTVIPSTIDLSAPSVVPFQESSTTTPSPAGSASTSTSSTPSSVHPLSAIPAVKLNRTLLPTVRVSPGYVEHTGSYRVYNNTTGRGWRYSPPSARSMNSQASGSQIQPFRGKEDQEGDIKHRFIINYSSMVVDSTYMALRSSTPDNPSLECRINTEECFNPEIPDDLDPLDGPETTTPRRGGGIGQRKGG
ncbi:hypothetical protein F5Y12DRAFT_710600 [Xylaria sp. FL1777]|nr:hypothetical protein F5Y12DRAFT_710600 [Xylaria sp. FL1777]